MRWWELVVLGAIVFGAIVASAGLWLSRRDRSASGRQRRQEVVGIYLLLALIPLRLFLEDRIWFIPYIALQILLLVAGFTLLIRSGVWRRIT